MGTVFQVPWTRHAGVAAGRVADPAAPRASTSPRSRCATTRSSLDAFAADRPERVALVLGAEGDGLTPACDAGADTVVTIPMDGGVDSLNVAAAAAVALWALREQHVRSER